MQKGNVHARMDAEQLRDLERFAAQLGLNASAVIRALAEAFLEAMRRDGAVVMPMKLMSVREAAESRPEVAQPGVYPFADSRRVLAADAPAVPLPARPSTRPPRHK